MFSFYDCKVTWFLRDTLYEKFHSLAQFYGKAHSKVVTP